MVIFILKKIVTLNVAAKISKCAIVSFNSRKRIVNYSNYCAHSELFKVFILISAHFGILSIHSYDGTIKFAQSMKWKINNKCRIFTCDLM